MYNAGKDTHLNLVLLLTALTLGPLRVVLQDAQTLALAAETAGVPKVVGLAVAWEETRDGSRGNSYLGAGLAVFDSASGRTKRVCRELGRMQVNPCYHWTYISPSCARDSLRVYSSNVRCGMTILRRRYEEVGSWQEAIRRYNGRGPKADDYLRRVLATIGRLTLESQEASSQGLSGRP